MIIIINKRLEPICRIFINELVLVQQKSSCLLSFLVIIAIVIIWYQFGKLASKTVYPISSLNVELWLADPEGRSADIANPCLTPDYAPYYLLQGLSTGNGLVLSYTNLEIRLVFLMLRITLNSTLKCLVNKFSS